MSEETTTTTPRFHSAPSGLTRYVDATVISLDVWGHVSAECDAGCPCVHDGEHDDNACQCTCNINAAYRAGTVRVQEIEIEHNLAPDGSWTEHTFTSWQCSDAEVIGALIRDDAAEGCEVDRFSDDEWHVTDANGRPIVGIRFEQEIE